MKRAVTILSCIILALACLVLAFLFYFLGVTRGVRLDPAKLRLASGYVRVYDDAGVEVASALGERAQFSTLPPHLPAAFVAVEDKRFYAHHGFDYLRMGKALCKNIASFSFREGASTISQQLIKNTHLTGEKTIRRKLREYKLTRALEKRFSKEEILTLYLNSIYFGHSAFGVEEAARFYFDKHAEALLPAESAMLAALVRSPNRYSPFRNAEKCLARRNFVLGLMKEQGALTEREYEEALAHPLPQSPAEQGGAGRYLSLVYHELAELFPDVKASELLSLKVYTAMNSRLQRTLEGEQAENDISAIVLDNGARQVKAFHTTAGVIKRLPASTIKPLAVYAPALEAGLISPATPILNERTDFGGYSPQNYNGEYGGYVSARYALSHSVNIPAVKLLNELGIERARRALAKLGLQTGSEDKSLALALGGMREGFTLPALADGYAALAAGGTYAPARTIVRVEDNAGRVLYAHTPNARRVFSAETSFLVNDMLRSSVEEGTAKSLRSLGFPLCAKTGTGAKGAHNLDAYCMSYTPLHTVGVWMGNRDNSPIQTAGGGKPTLAAKRILQALYEGAPPPAFPQEEGVVQLSFDRAEYETRHRIVRADPLAPPIETRADYFCAAFLPEEQSTRFSRPTIEKPSIFVQNGAVTIELCHAEYYEYVVKRKNNGEELTVYSGKYREWIVDDGVVAGERYEYSVTPYYREHAGEQVMLPAVKVPPRPLPDDWWED